MFRPSHNHLARLSKPLLFAAALALAGVAGRAQSVGWRMKGFDAQRTGQSDRPGPLSLDTAQCWATAVPSAFVINIGATATDRGIFTGSWGVVRRDSLGRGANFIDKYDGKLYALDPRDGSWLWGGPRAFDLTPYYYDSLGRTHQVSYYNGTVEGQAAVDSARGSLYVGRGDGKLYCVDASTGAIRWRFRTFNPRLPDDPDGGGEVITSPLPAPDGTVYFGSWAAGPYETDAAYAVRPDGSLRWRWPSDSSLAHRIFYASPALSRDGRTVYFGTYYDGEPTVPGSLFAFRTDPGPLPDSSRLLWRIDLQWDGLPVWVTTIAVGARGIYVGGFAIKPFVGDIPVVFALYEEVGPDGPRPRYGWATPYRDLPDGTDWCNGIALHFVGTDEYTLFATTANLRANNNRETGELYAIDPASGNVLAAYDPSDDVPAAVGGLTSPAIGADGTVYFGVRGKFRQALVDPVDGQVFAVRFDESAGVVRRLWNFETDGYLEWNHPAIGPDGGIYLASSTGSGTDLAVYDPGVVPPNAVCTVYGLHGPTGPMRAGDPPPSTGFELEAPYPNPARGETTIGLTVSRPSPVEIRVVSIDGRIVRSRSAARFEPGRYRWDLVVGGLPSGAYIVEAHAGVYAARALLLVAR